MKRIFLSVFLLAVAVVAANLFFNTPAQTSENEPNGTFYGYLSSEPTNLDPARGVDVNESTVQLKIFDGLVRYNEKMELVGNLAESWSVSADGTEFIFNLKKNAKFHNGQPFTAQDVVFSLDRIADPKIASPRSWVLEKVEGTKERLEGKTTVLSGVKALGDHKASIKLKAPFAPFLSLLTMPACCILPHKSAKEIESRVFFEKPFGTGPFMVSERVRDSRIILKANTEYHGSKPLTKQIECRIITDNMKAEMEFECGNLDMLQLYPANFDRFYADASCRKRIINVPALNVFYVGFNNEKKPFNDVRVRKALNMLIDRSKIIKAVYQGRAAAAKGSIPNEIAGCLSESEVIKFNPQEGLRLLKEAGYSADNPLKFDLYQRSAQSAFEITRLLQGELRKYGVIASLKPMEWSALKDAINKGEASAFYMSWYGDYPDGENFLFPLFHSSNIGSGGNRARFKDNEIDKMIENTVKIQDEHSRAKAYEQINKRITEKAPWLYLWHASESYITSPRVKHANFFFCDNALTLELNK